MIRFGSRDSGIVSDGKQILVKLDSLDGAGLMADITMVTSWNMDVSVGAFEPRSAALTIEMICSNVSYTEGVDLDFSFADNMSVRELLEMVNKKLKARSERHE